MKRIRKTRYVSAIQTAPKYNFLQGRECGLRGNRHSPYLLKQELTFLQNWD